MSRERGTELIAQPVLTNRCVGEALYISILDSFRVCDPGGNSRSARLHTYIQRIVNYHMIVLLNYYVVGRFITS